MADTTHALYLGRRQDRLEDILFREDTFMSLKSRSLPAPPAATSLGPLPPAELPPVPGTPEPSPRPPRAVSPLPPDLAPAPQLAFATPHQAFATPRDFTLGAGPGFVPSPADKNTLWSQ